MSTRCAVVLSVLALFVVNVPDARATYDPLASGATRLTLSTSFMVLLKRNRVELSASDGAKLKGRTISFPVSGGKFDPRRAKGTVDHEGTLLLQAGRHRIRMGALLLRTTQKHAPFSVKLGGSQLKLAETPKVVITRAGFGSTIGIGSLTLSAKVAIRLGRKLHLRGVFEPGQALGSSATTATPLTVALQGSGRISFELDPSFTAKLQSLFVAVNPIFPAEHPGPFAFPIFGGTLAPDSSSGRLAAQGALEFLQLGGGQVFWREPHLDFADRLFTAEAEVDPEPPYGGKLGPVSVAGLSGGNPSADQKSRTLSLGGVTLTSEAATAAIFNEVFAKPQGKDGVFVAGEALGSLAFTARGQ